MDSTKPTNPTDAERIDAMGGVTAVAKKLGIDKTPGAVQRVWNWKTRGIPASVKLQYPRLFLGPIKAAKQVA